MSSSAHIKIAQDQPLRRAKAIEDAADLLLSIRTLASLLDDLQQTRIANTNRMHALTRLHGEALPHLHIADEQLRRIEHEAELELKRAWRKHPIAPWAKGVRGAGEKLLARLIAEIGDPSIGSIGHWETGSSAPDPGSNGGSQALVVSAPENFGSMPETEARRLTAQQSGESRVSPEATRPAAPPGESIETSEANVRAARNRVWVIDEYYDRSLRQLWAYCGVGDPARSKIPKGAVQAELLARGRPQASKHIHNIAAALLKSGIRNKTPITDWGKIYMDAREKYADRVHEKPCPMCHAKAGDPWRPGHQHGAALRILKKEFLRELWLYARDLRGLH